MRCLAYTGGVYDSKPYISKVTRLWVDSEVCIAEEPLRFILKRPENVS